MNIHPAIVHFPIALLVIYAAIEIISRLTKLNQQSWVEPLKAVLVILGSLAAMLTLSTGEAAEHLLRDRSLRPLVETHSTIATATTWIFALLAGVYVLHIVLRQSWYAKVPTILQKLISAYLFILDRSWLITIGAVIGLVAVTITGALGGAIVYGPDTDPVVRTIYHWFF